MLKQKKKSNANRIMSDTFVQPRDVINDKVNNISKQKVNAAKTKKKAMFKITA